MTSTIKPTQASAQANNLVIGYSLFSAGIQP